MSDNGKDPGGGTQEQVLLDEEFSPLILTVGQYEFYMANGSVGMDAMALYMHLQYTARRQETNTVWAANTYLKKGLGMGEPRIKRAKAFLKEHGIIEYVQRHDNTGQFKKTYIKLRFIHRKTTVDELTEGMESTGGIDTAPPVNRTTGDERQMLKVNNSNALSKKEKRESVPKNEYFDEIIRLKKEATGLTLPLYDNEKKLAVDLAKKHKAGTVLTVWKNVLEEKPNKSFYYFAKDTNFEDYVRKEPEKPTVCPRCQKEVGHVMPDEGMCMDCYRATIEADEVETHSPEDEFKKIHEIFNGKTPQRQPVAAGAEGIDIY